MDRELFDAWTRSLVASSSRRRALKTVAGGALGGLLTRIGLGKIAAGCGAHAKPCKADGGCCSGLCERKGKCAKNGKLTGKCRCRCPQGTAECGTKGCCGAGEECQGGECVPAADACSPACTGGQECEAGACACPAGTASSCGSATSGVCHCCPVGQVHCGGGVCRECCGHLDCPQNAGPHCDLNFGGEGHCVCYTSDRFQCEPGGRCHQCCGPADCDAIGRVGFICNDQRVCRCDDGSTGCVDGSPSGTQYYCPDYLTDKMNCGQCGRHCFGRNCIDGQCEAPS